MIKMIFQALAIIGKLGVVKNWKTTGIGLIGAVMMVVFDQINAGVTDWQTYAKAALVAIGGILAKDADATGGMRKIDTGNASVVTSANIPVTPPAAEQAKDTSMEGLQ